MALKSAGEKWLAELIDGEGLYVGLGRSSGGNTELTAAHGYSRTARVQLTPANLQVNSSNNRIEVIADVTIYTASDGSAEGATHILFYEAANSATGDFLFDAHPIGSTLTPAIGQQVNLEAGFYIDLAA